MGVSKKKGIPKWMVKIMENPIKMDDLGGKNLYFWFNTHIVIHQPKCVQTLCWRSAKNEFTTWIQPPAWFLEV